MSGKKAKMIRRATPMVLEKSGYVKLDDGHVECTGWRKDKYKVTSCPHEAVCNDHCALFGEPREGMDGGVYLCLCANNSIRFQEFIDERV